MSFKTLIMVGFPIFEVQLNLSTSLLVSVRIDGTLLELKL